MEVNFLLSCIRKTSDLKILDGRRNEFIYTAQMFLIGVIAFV